MLAKMLAQTLGFVSRTFIRVGVQTTGQMADAGKNHVGALGRINGNTGPLREALGNVVALLLEMPFVAPGTLRHNSTCCS